ncbi:MAG: hypothetical protein RLZZ58_2165 [Pseudomonadota bacterium]
MSMDPYLTANIALPLLAVGQAQKEATHNGALALIDLLLAARAVDVGVNTPPTTPQPGQCWIIGAAPTGDWTGRAGQIAGWTDGGWRFISPWAGLGLRVGAALSLYRHNGIQWVPPAASAAPSGGTVIDSQARIAIATISAALVAHGLLSAA